MTISSDLVRMDVIDSLFRSHLPTMMVHNGISFTTTEKIRLLFDDKAKIKMLKEEQSHERLKRLQHSEHGDDDEKHRLDGVGAKYDIGY